MLRKTKKPASRLQAATDGVGRATGSPRRRRRSRASVESLESRRLLAYPITDVGSLIPDGPSYASDVNEAGQVVGRSSVVAAEGWEHAFLYSGGVMTDLGVLGTPPNSETSYSEATSINDAGQVVGYSTSAEFDPYVAFSYSGGAMTALGTLGPEAYNQFNYSSASGVNNAGQIVGTTSTPHGTWSGGDRAFLYSGGAMANLGTLGVAKGFDGNYTFSRGTDINNAGHVVGSSITSAGESHAFVLSGGGMQDLGTLGPDEHGTNDSVATAINDSGRIVGFSTTAAGYRAFLHSAGAMKDLGTIGLGQEGRSYS